MAGEPVQRRLQFVLEHFGKRPTQNVILNYFSMANEVYTITVGEERYVVKNCFKNNRAELIENETAMIRRLQEKGIATPELVATKDGHDYLNYDGQFYVMNRFVDGYTPTWEDTITQSVSEESVRAMADFHRAMEGFSLPYDSGRIKALDINAAKRWLLDLQTELRQDNSGRASVTAMLPVHDRYLQLVSRVENEMSERDLSVLSPTVIHGDIHCFNLIFSQDKSQYISILDFDFIREDYRLVDFYWASRSVIWHYAYGALFGEKPPRDREPPLNRLSQATDFAIKMMIDVYRKHHKISDEELRLLPLFAMLMPLYTVRFFSLKNSEDECLRHSEWFDFQLKHIDMNVELITHAIEKALDKH